MTFKVKLIPTILFIPLLYLVGWLLVQPLRLFPIDLSLNNLSLIGSVISLSLFFILLRNWIETRWPAPFHNKEFYYFHLYKKDLLKKFWIGFYQAFVLIFFILIVLNLSHFIHWNLRLNLKLFIDSFFLCFFVGLAEEVIFRGWLWGEMNLIFGSKLGNTLQAIIFSLIHLRFGMELIQSLILFIGLFLLGLVLAQRRNLDRGSLWGCIGLHGGLVGIWFFVQYGLMDISWKIPSWFIGPGDLTRNPIGGIYAIISLLIIFISQRDKEIVLLRSLGETCKASSKDALP